MFSKKIFLILLISTLIFTALLISPSFNSGIVHAEALPPLCTGFQLQNTDGTTTAIISVAFYDIGENDGIEEYTFNLPDIAPNASRSFYVPSFSSFSTMISGSYSAIVSSNVELNALVNEVTCSGSTPFVYGSHSGAGMDDLGTTVYIPFVISRAYAQGFSSYISVQNAASGDNNVKIEFFRPGNAVAVETFTLLLKKGETWYLDLDSGMYATANLLGFSGAAKITGAGPVASVVNYGPANSSMLASFNGMTTGSQKLFAPQVTKFAFAGVYTSGLTVYNPNPTATPFKVEFIRSGQTTPVYTYTGSVSANNVWIQYVGSLSGLPNGFNGTAVVTVTSGTNKVYGIATMASNSGESTAINLVPVEDASNILYFPQIVRTAFGGYESGWQVVNTTGVPVNLTVEYWRDTNVKTYTQHLTLGANSAVTNYVGSSIFETTIGDGWNGGVIVKVDDDSKSIVGQANFVAPATFTGDKQFSYNAFK